MTQTASSAGRAGAPSHDPRGNAVALQSAAVAGPQVSRRDSKQQDYGAMARQLASDGQWADRVLSPSSPSTSSRPAAQIYEVDGQSRPRQEITQHPDEMDPPPAYSDVTRVHELPAVPARQADSQDVAQAELAADLQLPQARDRRSSSSSSFESEEENPRSRLLDRRRHHRHHRHEHRRRFRGRWHKSSHSRGHCCKAFLFTVAAMALILLLVIRIGATKSRTWFGTQPESPKPTALPEIPGETGFSRHEPTKNIEGVYKLYDYIDFSTETGAIDVVIEPQPGTTPAILKLTSTTGSITVHFAPSFLRDSSRPVRTFRTFIKTTTGPIYGDVVLGSGGVVNISTHIGLVLFTIWTSHVGHDNTTSTIETTSYTGDQSIQVIPLDNTDSVSAIVGNHRTKATGSLDVTYPPQWQGKVHAMGNGIAAVTVSGSDLNYIRADEKETVAFRGSLADAKVVSLISQGTGSIDFKC